MTREATTFSIMAYATGLRLLAGLFCLTGVGIPIGVVFWYLARQKEKERERELEAIEQAADS